MNHLPGSPGTKEKIIGTKTRERLYLTLTSARFTICLGLLILNDWWLKANCPGLLSGKLSDFAGLAVVAMLLMAAWPHRVRIVCVGLGGMFLWWKSPLSDHFIELLNSVGPVRFGRTVDYSDLVALVILPACRFRTEAIRIRWANLRKVIFVPACALSALGIMGTSLMQTRDDYSIRRTPTSAEFRREAVAETIAAVAKRHDLTCGNCSNPTSSATFEGHAMTLTYSIESNDVVRFQIWAMPDGLFFGRSGGDKANALRFDLKRLSQIHSAISSSWSCCELINRDDDVFGHFRRGRARRYLCASRFRQEERAGDDAWFGATCSSAPESDAGRLGLVCTDQRRLSVARISPITQVVMDIDENPPHTEV